MKTAEEMIEITMNGIADKIMEAARKGETSVKFVKLSEAMREHLKDMGYTVIPREDWVVEW